MKSKIIVLLSLLLIGCKSEEILPIQYRKGDTVYIYPNKTRVTVETEIPAGYIVYTANKFNVVYFVISRNQIIKL